MSYNALLYYRGPPLLHCRVPSCCGVFTLQNERNTAAGNIGVSTLEDGRDTELTTVGNNGVSTLVDGTDTKLNAVGNNGVSTLEDGKDTKLTVVGNNGVSTLEDGRDTELTALEILVSLPRRMVRKLTSLL
jgi:hypothetical protein